MSIETLPRLARPGGDGLDDPFEHVFCCDPDRSLCGLDISGEPDVGDGELEAPCPLCEALEDLPCGAEGCPDV